MHALTDKPVNVFSIESTMENDLFAEAYAKEVGSVVETTIRCLTILLRGSKFYLKIYSIFFTLC